MYSFITCDLVMCSTCLFTHLVVYDFQDFYYKSRSPSGRTCRNTVHTLPQGAKYIYHHVQKHCPHIGKRGETQLTSGAETLSTHCHKGRNTTTTTCRNTVHTLTKGAKHIYHLQLTTRRTTTTRHIPHFHPPTPPPTQTHRHICGNIVK